MSLRVPALVGTWHSLFENIEITSSHFDKLSVTDKFTFQLSS